MLTPSFKRTLIAKAHALKPVVMVGNKGLTEAVLLEVEQAFITHEIIKIRLNGEREDRKAMQATLVERCPEATLIQSIGHIVVFYQPKKKMKQKKS